MTSVTDTSLREALDRVLSRMVQRVPGVTGAVISSADGFVLAERLPPESEHDGAGVAAMSAAALALADRMVRLAGGRPALMSSIRSDDGDVYVFAIGRKAVFTIVSDMSADAEQVRLIGDEVAVGLEALFTGSHDSRSSPQAAAARDVRRRR